MSATIRGQLYAKFKEDNKEAWQEILELHNLLESSEVLPQTIAHSMQSFGKIKRQLINLFKVGRLLLVLTHTEHNQRVFR